MRLPYCAQQLCISGKLFRLQQLGLDHMSKLASHNSSAVKAASGWSTLNHGNMKFQKAVFDARGEEVLATSAAMQGMLGACRSKKPPAGQLGAELTSCYGPKVLLLPQDGSSVSCRS